MKPGLLLGIAWLLLIVGCDASSSQSASDSDGTLPGDTLAAGDGIAPGDETPVPSCAPDCAAFSSCDALVTLACTSLCDDPTTVRTAQSCLADTAAGNCYGLRDCLGMTAEFISGPSGTGNHDTAGDFTVETTNGPLVFSQYWTGNDSYVFLFYQAGNSYLEELWASRLRDLLEYSPVNVHYFVLALRDQDGTDRHVEQITLLEQLFADALADLGGAAPVAWEYRWHFVTELAPSPTETSTDVVGGWLGEVCRERGLPHFAVDRYQRLRKFGHLGRLGVNGYFLRQVGYEVELYNFEYALHERLRYLASETVTVADQVETDAEVDTFIELPTGDDLTRVDTLEVQLALECLDHDEPSYCGEWDYLARLYLCDLPSAAYPDENDTPCTTELARWVTPYAREGRWLTDISPALALLGEGGRRRVKFRANPQPERCAGAGNCWQTPYIVTLELHLRDADDTIPRPRAFEPLYVGQWQFDENYNDLHAPVTFTPPSGTTRVELFALISGHGWGAEVANCAEFCNHQHEFVINGATTYLREHPSAGSANGCADAVSLGVVPNQYGTWPYGRGGWCPGLEVAPYRVDITAAVDLASANQLVYRGLLNGQPYQPVLIPPPDSSDYRANIIMNSFLVFW